MPPEIVFEGPLRLDWLTFAGNPAIRADQFQVHGPRDGRYRIVAGQVMEPAIISADDVDALKARGAIDVVPVANIELTEASVLDLHRLLTAHLTRTGLLLAQKAETSDDASS